jgi:ribosomal protein S13
VARIAGVDLPRDKRIEIGLTYIYGIGLTRAKQVIAKTGVNPDTRVKDLSDADVSLLRETVESDYQIEGEAVGRSAYALSQQFQSSLVVLVSKDRSLRRKLLVRNK